MCYFRGVNVWNELWPVAYCACCDFLFSTSIENISRICVYGHEFCGLKDVLSCCNIVFSFNDNIDYLYLYVASFFWAMNHLLKPCIVVSIVLVLFLLWCLWFWFSMSAWLDRCYCSCVILVLVVFVLLSCTWRMVELGSFFGFLA